MKYALRIREAAAREIIEIRGWYDREREGLGEEFMDELRAGVRSATANPMQYPIYYKAFRRVLLKRFRYKVFYQVQGRSVIIFHVLHQKRDHTPFLEEEA
jgi:plasmid stabilization system protein ParE